MTTKIAQGVGLAEQVRTSKGSERLLFDLTVVGRLLDDSRSAETDETLDELAEFAWRASSHRRGVVVRRGTEHLLFDVIAVERLTADDTRLHCRVEAAWNEPRTTGWMETIARPAKLWLIESAAAPAEGHRVAALV